MLTGACKIFIFVYKMETLVIKVKEVSGGLIGSLGFDVEPIVTHGDGVVMVNVQCDDPALLIGRGGEGIDALQHIMRSMLRADLMEKRANIVLDIANYRDKRNERVQQDARELALQVLSTGVEEVLPPMSSYERRLVHMIVKNMADVETESRGEGRERKIVIKPKKVGK